MRFDRSKALNLGRTHVVHGVAGVGLDQVWSGLGCRGGGGEGVCGESGVEEGKG